MKVNRIGKMACPTGFEPVTCCLEGNENINKNKGHSNSFPVCSPYSPANESIAWDLVGIYFMPHFREEFNA